MLIIFSCLLGCRAFAQLTLYLIIAGKDQVLLCVRGHSTQNKIHYYHYYQQFIIIIIIIIMTVHPKMLLVKKCQSCE